MWSALLRIKTRLADDRESKFSCRSLFRFILPGCVHLNRGIFKCVR